MDCAEMLVVDLVQDTDSDGLQQAIILRPSTGQVDLNEPHLDLHVIHVDGTDFEEGVWVARVPIATLSRPVRIGRQDLDQIPPIVPEIDLGFLLAQCSPDGKWVVSRLHAALELDEFENPALRQVGMDHSLTWTCHSGERHYHTVGFRHTSVLWIGDVILLGQPGGRNVKIRVRT
jgi:hypothetical protein